MTTIHKALAACLLLLSLHTGAICQQNLPPVTVTATTNVDKAVTSSFARNFPDALDAQWFRASKNFLVRFMMTDQQNSALIKKNGQIVYHIACGYEKDLPSDVRMIVRTHYPDFSITTAITVEEQGRKIWVVNLQDKKKLILVRIEDGELEEVGNYNKTI
ncbi:MAG TPA: hypothetical protein VHE34_03115 [Puia sp.]|uniref:hypothetical protein n=1 Tax=Puia sp. TaxID=2045100 RepID=UPI002BE134A3|nr:hypothetical protein [Puia sp.]HVU94181.1 hypothetical protein [Puia sp.]